MARTERSGHTTTDHGFIRGWVEERGGWPARVAGTGAGDDAGLIRIDFPGYSGEGTLERIEWEEWFQKFDDSDLAFLHRDMSHGGDDLDRFNKLVRRGTGDEGEGASGSRGRSSRSASSKSNGGTRSSSKSGGTRASSRAADGGSRSGGGRSASRASGEAKSGSSRSRAASSTADGATSGSRSRSSGDGASSRSSRSGGSTSSSGRSTAKRTTASRGGATAERAQASGRSNGRGRANGADGSEIRELLIHELGDLLFAERLFLKSTKTLAKEAQDPEVKERCEEHVRETEGQIERLQQAFATLGEKAKPVKCEAALGLQEEHDSFKSEEKPSKLLLSAFDLGSGLRVEHYEIAAYRSAIAVAEAVGERECGGLLKENLKEEMNMASFLEKNSKAVLRRTMAAA